MLFQIIVLTFLLGLIAAILYLIHKSRLRHCSHCQQRTVHVLTRRQLTEGDLLESFDFLKRRDEDLVSGPSGMSSMIVIIRPTQKIFRPAWLFGEFNIRPVQGTVLDAIETATCSDCFHETIEVSSRVDQNHPECQEIRHRVEELRCPDCSDNLRWRGDLWRDNEFMTSAEYWFVAHCPTCDADIEVDCDFCIVPGDSS